MVMQLIPRHNQSYHSAGKIAYKKPGVPDWFAVLVFSFELVAADFADCHH
jgi:hypothetical protein